MRAALRPLLIANVVFAAWFVGVLFAIYPELDDRLFLHATDARGYVRAGEALFGAEEGLSYLGIRPFLYPLFVHALRSTLGLEAVVMAQALMWLGSLNLVYLALLRATGRPWLGLLGACLVGLDLGYVAVSAHVLSEGPAAFLSAVFAWWVVGRGERFPSGRFLAIAIFLLAVMTLIRPVHLYPCLGLALFTAARHRRRWADPRALFAVSLALAPLGLQLAVSKARTGEATLSKIGGLTLRYYFFTTPFAELEGLERNAAKLVVKEMSLGEIAEYVAAHPGRYARAYAENLWEGVAGPSLFLDIPRRRPRSVAFHIAHVHHRVNFFVHASAWALLAASLLLRRRRWREPAWQRRLFTFLLVAYLILTAGFSGFQGDRLTLPTAPLWIVFYLTEFHAAVRVRRAVRS